MRGVQTVLSAAAAATRPYYVYLLGCTTSARTYIGCTNNLRRRLRQHNGELHGGARSTRGQHWAMRALVGGFESRTEALSFEYYSKRPHLLRPGRCSWSVPSAVRHDVRGVDRRAALLHAMAASSEHLRFARRTPAESADGGEQMNE